MEAVAIRVGLEGVGQTYPLTIFKSGDVMIKTGDMFKSIENGKMFAVKSADSRIIILGTKDRPYSMLDNPNSMESICVPFVENEIKTEIK